MADDALITWLREHELMLRAHAAMLADHATRLDEHGAHAHELAPDHDHDDQYSALGHVHADADEIVPALIDLADEAGESVEEEATAAAEEVEPPKEEPSTPEPETAPLRIHPLNRRVVGRRE